MPKVTSINGTLRDPGSQWSLAYIRKEGSFISLLYDAEHTTLEVIYNDQGREIFRVEREYVLAPRPEPLSFREKLKLVWKIFKEK
jgi:hypothetical protein